MVLTLNQQQLKARDEGLTVIDALLKAYSSATPDVRLADVTVLDLRRWLTKQTVVLDTKRPVKVLGIASLSRVLTLNGSKYVNAS